MKKTTQYKLIKINTKSFKNNVKTSTILEYIIISIKKYYNVVEYD